VGFRDLVGVGIAPITKKTAVKFYHFYKFFHFFRSPIEANQTLEQTLGWILERS
jgi:hypothetical protein